MGRKIHIDYGFGVMCKNCTANICDIDSIGDTEIETEYGFAKLSYDIRNILTVNSSDNGILYEICMVYDPNTLFETIDTTHVIYLHCRSCNCFLGWKHNQTNILLNNNII